MSVKRHGHRTKYLQDCNEETPVVYYTGREFGTFAEDSACMGKDPDGSELLTSLFVNYEAYQFSNLPNETRCPLINAIQTRWDKFAFWSIYMRFPC